MGIKHWIKSHGADLRGRLIAITGTTGGLGQELCGYLAELGADLILLDRNPRRSQALRQSLLQRFPHRSVECLTVDLEDAASVKRVTEQLESRPIDVFVHNAGAYSIPRHVCDETGYDNVFQINFVSPYYMIRRLLPLLRRRGGRAVVVGSIAHNYSKADPADVDFSTRKAASKVYGNAKRYLMYGMAELMKNETKASLSIAHPGITFTNITAHYPKVIFAIIKHPMKVIFMKPRKAVLCILSGILSPAGSEAWIGPRLFDVWGYPARKRLRTAAESERELIAARAEEAYERMEAVGGTKATAQKKRDECMKLFASDLHFRGKNAVEQAYDLCIHGRVTFQINGEDLSDETEWCVSASAYRFLHALFSDHSVNGEECQMIPCCGHQMISLDNGRRVSVVGCTNGIDFEIRHQSETVWITTAHGVQYAVPYGEYREAVLAFAIQVDDFYRAAPIRKFEEDFEREGFVAFLNEWHSLLCRAKNSGDTMPPMLPISYFSDYEKYWEDAISEISAEGIRLNGGRLISFRECAESFGKEYGVIDSRCVGERDVTGLWFLFYTLPKPIMIVFRQKSRLWELLSRENARKRFHDLQTRIEKLGYSTYDLS